MKNTPIITSEQAAKLVKEGDILLQGGFGMTGNPVHLMNALAETGTKNLTFVGNNAGEPGLGGGRLLSPLFLKIKAEPVAIFPEFFLVLAPVAI